MALGQRARQKLKRRQRSRPLTGDAASISYAGKRDGMRERWGDPRRSDLRRLRQAIAHGWLAATDAPTRQALVDIVMGVANNPRTVRHAIAAVHCVIAMDLANLRLYAGIVDQSS